MAAGILNLIIEQGSDFIQVLTITDSADSLIDLTGYTFAGKIRKKYSDSTVIKSFTFTILDQTSHKGEVRMSLTAAETASIAADNVEDYKRPFTKFIYDVEMTDTGPTTSRIMEGTIDFSPEVTR